MNQENQVEQNSNMEIPAPITIYQYHPVSGEYLWGQEYAPPVDVGLPAHSTEIEPPTVGENQVAVFSGEEWSVIPDYRGQTFYRKTDRAEIVIKEIGEVSDTFTNLAPTTIFDAWQNGTWVTDTVAEQNANLVSQISELEKQVTQRRIREAILGLDNGWLSGIEQQIEVLRGQLS